MARVLITGMSGTGTSTTPRVLAKLGHEVVLTAPADVIMQRVADRTTNDYGTSAADDVSALLTIAGRR